MVWANHAKSCNLSKCLITNVFSFMMRRHRNDPQSGIVADRDSLPRRRYRWSLVTVSPLVMLCRYDSVVSSG
jgi:hypothetical protein